MHNLLMQFFNPDSSKIEVFETCFFDIVTTQNDISSYAKHVLGRIYVFSPYLGIRSGGGGGSPKGRVHNLLMQFFNPDSSKIEVFETCFFDIVTTRNDISSYAKHALGRIYVFSPYLGVRSGGGGVTQGTGAQPAYAVFQPGQLKNRSFRNLFF